MSAQSYQSLCCDNCGGAVTAIDLIRTRRCSFCGSDLLQSLREYNRQIHDPPSGPAAPVLRITEIYLIDGLWDYAREHARTAIKIDPRDYHSYLYLLLAEMQVSTIVELAHVTDSFEHRPSYLMFRRYAPELARIEVDYFLQMVLERIDGHSDPPLRWDDGPPDDYVDESMYDSCDWDDTCSNYEEIYQRACQLHLSAVSYRDFKNAAELFGSIPHYKDADAQYSVCQRMYSSTQTEVLMKNVFKGSLFFSFFLLALRVLLGGI